MPDRMATWKRWGDDDDGLPGVIGYHTAPDDTLWQMNLVQEALDGDEVGTYTLGVYRWSTIAHDAGRCMFRVHRSFVRSYALMFLDHCIEGWEEGRPAPIRWPYKDDDSYVDWEEFLWQITQPGSRSNSDRR